ncbi:hypothetical protein [Xanthomonas phage BUDD]|nr:hypothetical protein [Xanthomonas phage BUDD]
MMENDFGIDYHLNIMNRGRAAPSDYLPPRPEKCLWKIIGFDGYVATYRTECGQLEEIKPVDSPWSDQLPEPSGKYCHHCGGRLHVNSTLKGKLH